MPELVSAALAAARLGLSTAGSGEQQWQQLQSKAAPRGLSRPALPPILGIPFKSTATLVHGASSATTPVAALSEAGCSWWSNLWSASLQLLPAAEPRHLVGLLWSARGAGRGAAPQHWVDSLVAQAARVGEPSSQQQAGEAGPVLTGAQLSADMLVSLVSSLPPVGVRPTASAVLPLMLLLERAAVQGQLTAQGIAAVLWAYSWLTRMQRTAQESVSKHPTPSARTAGGQRLAPWETSPGAAPTIAGSATAANRDAEAEQQLANVGQALAACFFLPSNLERSSPNDLSTGTLAMVMMRRRPPASAVNRLVNAFAHHAAALSVRELVVLLVGLPRLGAKLSLKLLASLRSRVMQLPHSPGGMYQGSGLPARARLLLLQQQQQPRSGGSLAREAEAEAVVEAMAPLLLSKRGRVERQQLLALVARLEARAKRSRR